MTRKSDIASKSLYNFAVEYIGKEDRILGLVLALIWKPQHAPQEQQTQNPIINSFF